MSAFEMIVVLLGGYILELCNISGVIKFMLSITFELLVDTDLTCLVQLRLLPKIRLQIVAFFGGHMQVFFN